MLASDLHDEIADSIRVHHASGHFTHAEAVVMMIAQTGWSTGRVKDRLALPVTDDDFAAYGTFPPGGVPAACAECGR